MGSDAAKCLQMMQNMRTVQLPFNQWSTAAHLARILRIHASKIFISNPHQVEPGQPFYLSILPRTATLGSGMAHLRAGSGVAQVLRRDHGTRRVRRVFQALAGRVLDRGEFRLTRPLEYGHVGRHGEGIEDEALQLEAVRLRWLDRFSGVVVRVGYLEC